jgi:predicted nuclease of restriction endonuclease-like (RecB) superfamily
MERKIENPENSLLNSLVSLIETARQKVAVTVNSELTVLYWNIGKQINEFILNHSRADYGKHILLEISQELTERYGSGFSKRNLHNFIKFSELYPDTKTVQTLSAQLSWSHINNVISIQNEIKRDFYIQLCIHERWSVRTLKDRIDSVLFERTAISKRPANTIKNDLELLRKKKQMSPDLAFRDPYFLDFLGLKNTYSEKDLESAILANLQNFITEMGSDFAFLARQKRIIIDNEDYYDANGYFKNNIRGTSPKEKYLNMADGRDCGLRNIDEDSEIAFKRWYENDRHCGGHPWEICRGGNSTHISFFVEKTQSGWLLRLAGSSYSRVIETVKMAVALYSANVRFYLQQAHEIFRMVTGQDYIGIVPETIVPRYCNSHFPPTDQIIDFMKLGTENKDDIIKKAYWYPEATLKLT